MSQSFIGTVAAAALHNFDAVLDHLGLGGGKRHGREVLPLNPLREDKSPGSFSINMDTGRWSDFASGDSGGDLVALSAWLWGCRQTEAAERLAGFLGIAKQPTPAAGSGSSNMKKPSAPNPAGEIVMPVPDDAPPRPQAHREMGLPSRVDEYRDEAGRLLFAVCRFDLDGGKKDIRPLSLRRLPSGRLEWRWLGVPPPRPLYGLDCMAAEPRAWRLIAEGEKAAHAAGRLLPDHVAVTWPNGAKAADKADWSPLSGSRCLLWADFDEPGREAMRVVARKAKEAGAVEIRHLNIALFERFAPDGSNGTPRLVERLAPLPAGWDAADAQAEGWTPAHIALLLQQPGAVTATPRVETAATAGAAESNESPYVLEDDGLYFVEQSRDGGIRQMKVCARLEVPALARDAEGGSWAPVLEFRDRDGHQRREVIPFRNFVGDGTDGIKTLADLGLEIMTGRQAMERLKGYVASARPPRRARLVDQSGWHGPAYLFPGEGAIGETDETLIYRGSRRSLGLFAPRGSLREWSERIGALATDNPRLIFSLASAFSGPLLKPCGATSCAFHWTGDSSIGKSGALAAAASVWGAPDGAVHSWRQTSNAVEFGAAQHNDGLFILDELKEVDPKEAGAITYMLSNSKGKGRAHHAGGLRDTVTWRIVMLSSGELGLGDHLASAGQKRYAGQEVRFIELAADAGAGLGMWNDLYGHADGRRFTDVLKWSADRYHGTAGRAFVAELVKRLPEIPHLWTQSLLRFQEDYQPARAGGQVLRVMASFALVAFAGELAAHWRIVPWGENSATAAAGQLFEEWLKERPSAGNSEEAQILAHVRGVMERNWQSRFIDWHRVTEDKADLSRMAAVHDALGFRKREAPFDPDRPTYLFYVTRARFAEEFAARGGFKPKRVAAVLRDKGILRCDSGSSTWKETLPNGDPRSHCLIGSELWKVAS